MNSRQEDLLNSLDDISQAKWDELQDSCVEGIQVSQVAPNALTAAYVEACPGTCTILQIFAFRKSLSLSLSLSLFVPRVLLIIQASCSSVMSILV